MTGSLEDFFYLEPDDITAVLECAAGQNDCPVLRSSGLGEIRNLVR